MPCSDVSVRLWSKNGLKSFLALMALCFGAVPDAVSILSLRIRNRLVGYWTPHSLGFRSHILAMRQRDGEEGSAQDRFLRTKRDGGGIYSRYSSKVSVVIIIRVPKSSAPFFSRIYDLLCNAEEYYL